MAKSLKEELLDEGIILIHSELYKDPDALPSIIRSIISLSAEDPTKPIKLYISSSMNDELSMMAIYDTIVSIPNPIIGLGIGHLDNYGTLLLAACSKGQRFALKHTVFNLEEPYGMLSPGQNQQTVVELRYQEVNKERKVLEELLASHSEPSEEDYHRFLSELTTFDAEEAKKMGLIDEILAFNE